MLLQTEVEEAIDTILDDAMSAIEAKDVNTFGFLMLQKLDDYRRSVDTEIWKEVIIPHARQHPVYKRALECPISKYSTRRPRGYAGDADLLDFLYRESTVQEYIEHSTEIGSKIAEYWSYSPAAAAVRYRRDYLADQIRAQIKRRSDARILSVACGHFRELISTSIDQESDSTAQFFGIDQDEISIKFVRQVTGRESLNLIHSSIGPILRGKSILPEVDLAYASGLFDYLDEITAQALAAKMFAALRPGGVLVISNFLDTAVNRASMELLQDWFLLYRSREEIARIAGKVGVDEIDSSRYHSDPFNTVGYYVVTKC